jgi:hypothetical protein
LRTRGQHNIRDTFISLALSAGEDPGWVAQLCGTSERMIFQHYRKFMANLRRQDGRCMPVCTASPAPMGTEQVSAAVSV